MVAGGGGELGGEFFSAKLRKKGEGKGVTVRDMVSFFFYRTTTSFFADAMLTSAVV